MYLFHNRHIELLSVDLRNFDSLGPFEVVLGHAVVAVSGPVADDVALALVELPVADQTGGMGVDIVHVFPYFVGRACYGPDAHLGDVAVELARVVVGLAEEELAEAAPALVLLIRYGVLLVEVVESPACEVERCGRSVAQIGTLALKFAVDVDADLARGIVVGGGDMVPLPGVEQLGFVLLGELAEAGRLGPRARKLK